MSTTAADSSKNGGQGFLEKVPWRDEQGIVEKTTGVLMTTLEVLLLFAKMFTSLLYALFKFFVPPEPKSVRDEVVMITGTGHGMGREMALRFANLGATVVCVDINSTSNKETADMIRESKGRAHTFECDVTSRDAVLALAEKVQADVGDVTMLINNAGIMPCKPLHMHSERDIRLTFDVNVIAHLWLLQSFLPAMMKKNHGHIVAMSSMAGLLGLRNLVPYCASKFAVRGLMEALHEELREDPRDFSGIKFTGIYPYIVDTGLCKNPKIKFPSLMKIVTPQEAADSIVDAVRREYSEITIPSSLFYVNQYIRMFPKAVPLHLKDFLDSGLESHE